MSNLAAWVKDVFGVTPKEVSLYERALTHGSHGSDTYERLEFLGDRVLGLVVAQWIYGRFPNDAEVQLSQRFNTLVSGETCAEVGRTIQLSSRMRLGKQALDDGAYDSDNVLGDVVEALIGAVYLEHGLEAAAVFIRTQWEPLPMSSVLPHAIQSRNCRNGPPHTTGARPFMKSLSVQGHTMPRALR